MKSILYALVILLVWMLTKDFQKLTYIVSCFILSEVINSKENTKTK